MKTFAFTRLLLISCFGLLSLTAINAQMSEGHLRFGFKAGINGTSVYDDAKASDKSKRIGLTAGAFLKVPMGSRWSLRPEVLFATKGATYNFNNNQKPDIKLNYIEFPLSLELSLLSFLNIHAGLHAAYLASASGKILDAQGNPISINIGKAEFEKLDYGWHLGTGLDFGNIGIHFRISRGLTDLKSGATLQSAVGNLKNSAWALTLSMAL
jgi:hypothetical protein